MRVAIQGELGSNSHTATLCAFEASGAAPLEVVPCALSAEVFAALAAGDAEQAVLPIENSLHGSVAEHYDLLLEHDVMIVGETSLPIRHNLIAAPGIGFADLRRVQSHPVALSQCRRWLAAHPHLEVVPGYDTAGSVKTLMERGLTDTAGIAPALAARQYGANLLVANIEDHRDNFTRFYTLQPGRQPGLDHFPSRSDFGKGRAVAFSLGKTPMSVEALSCTPRENGLAGLSPAAGADKLSLAFSLDHQPGRLVEALAVFAAAGLNLTRIESRPVPGRPWEYIFYVDLRFDTFADASGAVAQLAAGSRMFKVLGCYRAAATDTTAPIA